MIFGNLAWSDDDNHIIGRYTHGFPRTQFRSDMNNIRDSGEFAKILSDSIALTKNFNSRGYVQILMFDDKSELKRFKDDFVGSSLGQSIASSIDEPSCYYGLSNPVDANGGRLGILFVEAEGGVIDINRSDDADCVLHMFARNLGLTMKEAHGLVFPDAFNPRRPCIIAQVHGDVHQDFRDCPSAPLRRYEMFAAYLDALGAGITKDLAEEYLDEMRGACEYSAQNGYDVQEYCAKFIEVAG